MATKVKESKGLSLRMEKSIYERLVAFCEESGLSKTKAIERALTQYMDDYYAKMQKLQEMK